MPPPCDVDPDGRASRPQAALDGGDDTALAFTVPAHVTAPWLTRARVREWLEALRFPVDWIDDIVYVASEAVSNSAEHAYAPGSDGVITVEARAFPDDGIEDRIPDLWRVRMRVADAGAWRAVNPEPQHRGHGLAAIAALAAEVTIRRGEAGSPRGTEVIVVSPAARRTLRADPLRRPAG